MHVRAADVSSVSRGPALRSYGAVLHEREGPSERKGLRIMAAAKHPPLQPSSLGRKRNRDVKDGKAAAILFNLQCHPHNRAFCLPEEEEEGEWKSPCFSCCFSFPFFYFFHPERQRLQPATSLPVSYNYHKTDADYRRRERVGEAAAAAAAGVFEQWRRK